MGVFALITMGLAAKHGEEKTVMIDVTYLKAHRTASSLGVKQGGSGIDPGAQFPDERGRGRLIGRTKGDMNTKLHAVCDSHGRPLNLFVTAGPPLGDASTACRATGQ